MVDEEERPYHWYPFVKEVPLLDEVKDIHYSPCDGIIDTFIISFPPGCNALVEVKMFHEKDHIFPEKPKSIFLDDITLPFAIKRPVKKKDILTVIWINHDGTNPHTVPCIVGIREGRP